MFPQTSVSRPVSFIAGGRSSGTGEGNYSPEAELTRGEFIVLMMRAYGIAPDEDPAVNFADAGQVSDWATEAMTLLVKTDTIGGSGGRPDPTGTTTRAEMAQMLYNLLNK